MSFKTLTYFDGTSVIAEYKILSDVDLSTINADDFDMEFTVMDIVGRDESEVAQGMLLERGAYNFKEVLMDMELRNLSFHLYLSDSNTAPIQVRGEFDPVEYFGDDLVWLSQAGVGAFGDMGTIMAHEARIGDKEGGNLDVIAFADLSNGLPIDSNLYSASEFTDADGWGGGEAATVTGGITAPSGQTNTLRITAAGGNQPHEMFKSLGAGLGHNILEITLVYEVDSGSVETTGLKLESNLRDGHADVNEDRSNEVVTVKFRHYYYTGSNAMHIQMIDNSYSNLIDSDGDNIYVHSINVDILDSPFTPFNELTDYPTWNVDRQDVLLNSTDQRFNIDEFAVAVTDDALGTHMTSMWDHGGWRPTPICLYDGTVTNRFDYWLHDDNDFWVETRGDSPGTADSRSWDIGAAPKEHIWVLTTLGSGVGYKLWDNMSLLAPPWQNGAGGDSGSWHNNIQGDFTTGRINYGINWGPGATILKGQAYVRRTFTEFEACCMTNYFENLKPE